MADQRSYVRQSYRVSTVRGYDHYYNERESNGQSKMFYFFSKTYYLMTIVFFLVCNFRYFGDLRTSES